MCILSLFQNHSSCNVDTTYLWMKYVLEAKLNVMGIKIGSEILYVKYRIPNERKSRVESTAAKKFRKSVSKRPLGAPNIGALNIKNYIILK